MMYLFEVQRLVVAPSSVPFRECQAPKCMLDEALYWTWAAATTAGSAAEERAAKKVAKYALREPGGYDFTPLVVESYGRQCSATHTLLNLLGRLAADSGRVSKGAWVEGALRRLSIALCKGNDFLFRANLHAFCRAAGKHPTRGVKS